MDINYKAIAGFIAFFIVWGVASDADYEDALHSQKMYVERICVHKLHSDYLELGVRCDD